MQISVTCFVYSEHLLTSPVQHRNPTLPGLEEMLPVNTTEAEFIALLLQSTRGKKFIDAGFKDQGC